MPFSKAKNSLFDTVNSVFGTDAVYTHKHIEDEPTASIRGVFDNEFIEVNGVATKRPVLKNIQLSSLNAAPEDGDEVEIESVNYVVRYHEPDSHGTTTLILERI